VNAVRHHFVPQGFLRGFATSDDQSRSFVWVYDKASDRAPRKKSVRSIAWAPAYYAQEREDGSTDLDSLEAALAKTIDNEIPIILRSLLPTPGRIVHLDDRERTSIAFFLGLSLTRVPSFRDGINAMHSRIAQISLDHLAEREPDVAKIVEQYGAKAEAKQWVSLRPMIEMANAISTSALTKNWQFYLAPPGVSLVTSDNPVILSGGAVGLTEIGPAHPGTELVMNLRKDLALVCTPKGGYPSGQVFLLTPAEARKFNRGTVQAARQRVFADHESAVLDAFVKKYAGTEHVFLSSRYLISWARQLVGSNYRQPVALSSQRKFP
jgi:hypothetical protein